MSKQIKIERFADLINTANENTTKNDDEDFDEVDKKLHTDHNGDYADSWYDYEQDDLNYDTHRRG